MSHLLSPESAMETMRALIAGRPFIEGVDLCVRSTKTLTISAFNTELRKLSQKTDTELGLRLRSKKKVFSASTTQLDMDSLKDLLKLCERSLERIPEQPNAPKIHSLSYTGDTKIGISGDKTFGLTAVEEKINRVLNMGQSPNKVSLGSGEIDILNTYQETHLEEWLWTLGAPRYLHSAQICGELRTEVLARLKNHHIRLKSLHSDAQYYNLPWSASSLHLTQVAARLLDANNFPSGEYQMIFEKSVMAELIAIVAEWFMADRILTGRSVFSGPESQITFSSLFTLVDDPHQKKGIGSKAWDHEGSPTQRKVLIDRGQPSQRLHTLTTSEQMQDGTQGGNAFKKNPSSHPTVSYHSLLMEPGGADFVDLVREMQNGLIIYGIRGLESIHPRSGNFNFKVLGSLVVNGKETHAVKDMLIRGNLVELFSKLHTIGRDVFVRGNVSAPSALFSPVAVVAGGLVG